MSACQSPCEMRWDRIRIVFRARIMNKEVSHVATIPRCSNSVLVFMFVRTDILKSCPPDMSGHVPDMISDIETAVIERKTRAGRPDILAGHGFNLWINNDLGMVSWRRGYPLCPDMHVCARRLSGEWVSGRHDVAPPSSGEFASLFKRKTALIALKTASLARLDPAIYTVPSRHAVGHAPVATKGPNPSGRQTPKDVP